MTLICIDPGHGGSDPGAVANGLQEKDLTLDIGLRVEPRLKDHGFDVLMTRTTDVYVGLSARADMANQAGADYFLSIHINAGGGTGFESYIQQGTYPGKDETERLRSLIHDSVAAHFITNGMPDRGKKEADLAVIRETNMSASLFENGFIDHPYDSAKLADPTFLQGVAEAIVKGVCEAFGVTYVPPASQTSALWTVQVGAFREKANAEKLMAELKSKGYSAFVRKGGDTA